MSGLDDAEEIVRDGSSTYFKTCGPWAPLNEFEAKCTDALQSYDILNTEPEACFDDITQVASVVTDCPVGIVSFADSSSPVPVMAVVEWQPFSGHPATLIFRFIDYASHSAWFKSTYGLDVRSAAHGPTPEDKAAVFCIQACKVIQNDDIFEISDAEEHLVFRRNPAVKGLGLKFYAGAVLRTPDGVPLGTLCVMDKVARTLTDPQKRQLQILARSTEVAMEEHRQKGRRLSADWGELQGMGSASQGAPSILSSSCMDDDRELYATACPESGAGNPLSDFERKCLKELNSYQILDTEPEAMFDDITEVAAVCCNCPVGIVSLVDYENRRGFFKSTFGLDVKELPYGPTSEDKAAVFCVQACKIIQNDDVFEVEDATSHQVFCHNPAVKGLGLKFYAGAIVRAPGGTPMGTLCVMDTVPRTLTDQQKRQLAMLSRSTMEAMEAHKRRLNGGSEADCVDDGASDAGAPTLEFIEGRITYSGAAADEPSAPPRLPTATSKGSAVSSAKARSVASSSKSKAKATAPAAPQAPVMAAAPAAAPSPVPAPAAAAARAEEALSADQRGSPLLVAAWALLFLFLLVGTALALSSRSRREMGHVAAADSLTQQFGRWFGAAGSSLRPGEL